MNHIKRAALTLAAATMLTASSPAMSADYEFRYTIDINGKGDLIVRDDKGNQLNGVIDERPIKRINAVRTLTIIEGEGSHFIMINGRKYYLPH